MFELEPIKNEIKIKGFHSIYYFEFSKNFFHEPEAHDFWEMVYVDRGNVMAITNGIACELTQGQVIFHEPMEMHAHISDNKTPNNMMIISFSADSAAMDFFRGKTFTLDKNTKILLSLFLEETKHALGEIPSDYRNKNKLSFSNSLFGSSQLLECYLTEFLIKLTRTENRASAPIISNKESREIAANSMCELVCEYMKSNLYQKMTLKELCDRFYMGKTQMCKMFDDYLGQSPMEYFSSLRIKEAKALLRENTLSVTKIAELLQYSTIHTFSRKFKSAVGVSPTQYKKSIL